MKEQLTITIDPKIKKEAIKIFKENGQKMSSVIEIHLSKLIKEKKCKIKK